MSLRSISITTDFDVSIILYRVGQGHNMASFWNLLGCLVHAHKVRFVIPHTWSNVRRLYCQSGLSSQCVHEDYVSTNHRAVLSSRETTKSRTHSPLLLKQERLTWYCYRYGCMTVEIYWSVLFSIVQTD